MKRLSLVLLLLIVCVPAIAQRKTESQKPVCPLRLDQAPELRGLRMGMTQAAVLARLPGVTVEKPDKFGLARLGLTIVDSSSVIKSAAREKGVQPDMLAGPNEGSAFVLDSARFLTLKGVRKMRMRFIEGRLAYLEVSYDDDIKWESVEQFVETIATTLRLPQEWQTPADSDGSSHLKELRCDGFVITANTTADATDVHAGPELILQDLAAWEAMSKRQNDVIEKTTREENQKRKAFKP